jgi:hypothetical protein
MKTYKGKEYLPKNVDGKMIELTDAECEHIIAMNTEFENIKSAELQIQTHKKNANKKLLDLGLTQDEITALIGYSLPEEE